MGRRSLSAGYPAILGDLDQGARFKLGQVVMQPVRMPADQPGKVAGRAGWTASNSKRRPLNTYGDR
jgi:hypothetical protein